MDNVFTSKRWIITKILWAYIIFTSLAICGYQIYGRIVVYREYPWASSVSIESAHMVTFPALSICPFDNEILFNPRVTYGSEFRTSRGDEAACPYDVWYLIGMNYSGKIFTIETVYNMSRTMDQFTVELMARQNIKSDVPVRMFERLVFVGYCFTIAIDDPVHYQGRGTKLVLRRPATIGCGMMSYLINAHEPNAAFNVKATYYTCEKTYIDFAIEAKKFKRLDHPSRPCIPASERSKCYEKCLNRTFVEQLNCSLPYHPKYPENACKDGKEGNYVGQKSFNIMVGLDADKDCKCPTACEETIFTMTREGVNLKAPDNMWSFYYPDNHYILVEEMYTYDFVSLISDFGGSLGLWLGLSVISMFELLQNSVLVCRKK